MHGGHKVIVITEHYNNSVIMGTLTRMGAMWIGKTIQRMATRQHKERVTFIGVVQGCTIKAPA